MQKARKKSMSAVSRAYWAMLAGDQNTRMLIGMWTIKARLVRFQMGKRMLYMGHCAAGLLCYVLVKNSPSFCHTLRL
jgi:hypothetical protein